MDSILDNLFLSDQENTEMSQLSDDIIIPKKCAYCKTSIICTLVPNFMNISKLNILISVEQCPHYKPLKLKK